MRQNPMMLLTVLFCAALLTACADKPFAGVPAELTEQVEYPNIPDPCEWNSCAADVINDFAEALNTANEKLKVIGKDYSKDTR